MSVFKGLKVLDVASFIAGPAAATLLADFGADVVKVEVPEGAVVFEQRAPAARSFVPLRLAFDRELRASVDEVR